MRHKTLFTKIFLACCVVGTLAASCSGGGGKDEYTTEALMLPDAAISYAVADLSTDPPTPHQPTGSSSIDTLIFKATGDLSYNGSESAHAMGNTDSDPLEFDLVLKVPTMLQMAIEVEFDNVPDSAANFFQVSVNDSVYTFDVLESYNYDRSLAAVQIPEHVTQKGSNTIKVLETYDGSGTIFAVSLKFLPQKVIADDKNLATTIYTQFGETDLMKGTEVGGNIWTRSYGLSETMEMIPGPTLYYKPGDLLSVKIVNLLNPETSQALYDYQKVQERTLNTDEVLAGDQVRGEINIPHNLNNTNLHVHGLHVDPAKDDVTIVIVPEGADSTGYDAPHTHAPVQSLDPLNEFSVSDQGVKGGKWVYQYRIPENHLPGTHWFHPHKHGSTSAQVENGLAGTMVIMEDESNAIVPFPKKAGSVKRGTQTGYNLDDWRGEHDRVLAIQEITNFGLQRGQGDGKGELDSVVNQFGYIDLTLNGQDEMHITVQPGQLERWRIVNAGTNHRAFSQIWLGKNTGEEVSTFQPKTNSNGDTIGWTPIKARVFEPVDMHMVAVDGITLPKKETVNIFNPALLAPGNRSDFLVQLKEKGDYVLFKNYEPLYKNKGIAVRRKGEKKPFYVTPAKTYDGFWPADANAKNNAFQFANTGINKDNYSGFNKQWIQPGNTAADKSVVPIIRTKKLATDSGSFLDVDFAQVADFGKKNSGGFTPINIDDAQLTDAELMWITVKGDSLSGDETPLMPTDDYLASIAPTTSGKAPPYASPIHAKDILQSRPVIFDVSGTAVNVYNDGPNSPRIVNQFTLNGRYFVLNDPIGNPGADSMINRQYTLPSEIESTDDQRNITQKLEFTHARPIQWETNKVGDGWYFTNPGYYQDIVLGKDKTGKSAYKFSNSGEPGWTSVTGLDRPTVINETATMYEPNKDSIPGLPMAKTGEEWVLINNSDVSHPFHIHINPFFIVEVGQLSFEQYTDASGKKKTDWFMRAVTDEKVAFKKRPEWPANGVGAKPGTVYEGEIGVRGIVGNWWDTIVIPAHGYVKVRYWVNVPNQTGNGDASKLADDFNKTGIWVYHCHILRHEDRGMMMPVITMKNAKD